MPERANLPPSLIEEMPSPSAELTLIGAILRAHMQTLPPKKRRLLLKCLMEVFEEYEATSNVVRLRSKQYDGEVTKSRRGAVAWTRAMMAAFWVLDVDQPPR